MNINEVSKCLHPYSSCTSTFYPILKYKTGISPRENTVCIVIYFPHFYQIEIPSETTKTQHPSLLDLSSKQKCWIKHCKRSIATCVGTQLFFVARTALSNVARTALELASLLLCFGQG